MTEVPPLSAGWPLDEFQLAGLISVMHWELEQFAFDLPRGEVSEARKERMAADLERLAVLLRQHVIKELPPSRHELEKSPMQIDQPGCNCKDCRRQRGD